MVGQSVFGNVPSSQGAEMVERALTALPMKRTYLPPRPDMYREVGMQRNDHQRSSEKQEFSFIDDRTIPQPYQKKRDKIFDVKMLANVPR
jgi:hypothetical protein